MLIHRFRTSQSLLIVCALVVLSGCQSFQGYEGWPFPEEERTTFNTPALRIDAVRQIAGQADGTASVAQQELTNQLARQVQIEPDPLVRKAIVEVVAEFRTPLAPQILEAGLNDTDLLVRIACCESLGRRADGSAVASLSRVLKSDDEIDVRLAAADALGQIKTLEASAALVVALDDRDPAMQYAGVESLKSITGQDFGGDVAKWRQLATGGTPAPPAEPSIAERVRDSTQF